MLRLRGRAMAGRHPTTIFTAIPQGRLDPRHQGFQIALTAVCLIAPEASKTPGEAVRGTGPDNEVDALPVGSSESAKSAANH